MSKPNMIHETAHLYCVSTAEGYEIRFRSQVAGQEDKVVGTQPTPEKAKLTMERLERYPKNLRAFMGE
jgi:hypothetical protein